MQHAVAIAAAILLAASSSGAAENIPLWKGTPPGSPAVALDEVVSHDRTALLRNVTQPTLTAFLPDPAHASGAAVIVAPGGAFIMLAIDHEGRDVAKWLAARGIAAFVLEYRVAETPRSEAGFQELREAQLRDPSLLQPIFAKQVPLAIEDALQAVRVVREAAAQWRIRKDRVGMLGFSAGALLACAVATRGRGETRPDFAAAIYGPKCGDPVPADAPPLFIAAAADDRSVSPEESVLLSTSWRAAGRSAELHLYAEGGHGFGLYRQGLPSDHWIEAFHRWLTRTVVPR